MLIIPQDNSNSLVPKSSGQTSLTSSFYWIIMYFLNLVDSLWQFLYPICQLLENKKTNEKTHRKFALCQCLWQRRTITNKKRDQASNLPYNMLLYYRRRWHYEVRPVLMNYPEPWQPCTITCSAVGTTDKQQTMSNWDLAQQLIMIYLWHLWGNSICNLIHWQKNQEFLLLSPCHRGVTQCWGTTVQNQLWAKLKHFPLTDLSLSVLLKSHIQEF